MLRQMTQLVVGTDEEQGFIFIEQPDVISDELAKIILAPEQVPVLIEWLQEAKEEINALDKKHA
jgi:hypothetical protein